MWVLHVLWLWLTLVARPESKSFHQNTEKCEASFQCVIDDVCRCETLRQGRAAAGFVEAGR